VETKLSLFVKLDSVATEKRSDVKGELVRSDGGGVIQVGGHGVGTSQSDPPLVSVEKGEGRGVGSGVGPSVGFGVGSGVRPGVGAGVGARVGSGVGSGKGAGRTQISISIIAIAIALLANEKESRCD
jgi:hypothetical protein